MTIRLPPHGFHEWLDQILESGGLHVEFSQCVVDLIGWHAAGMSAAAAEGRFQDRIVCHFLAVNMSCKTIGSLSDGRKVGTIGAPDLSRSNK